MMLSPYLALTWTDPLSGTKGYVVLDALVRGLAAGGCRMRPGLTLEEVARLAHVMTLKFALFEVPLGGGKCGLDYDPARPDAPEVLERFFAGILPLLKENFITGEDMGTSQELVMATLARVGIPSPTYPAWQKWGLPETIGQTMAAALRLDVDGLPLESVVAGYGVAQCALEALAYKGIPVDRARVSIQGFGSVGGAAAKFLYQAGAKVVAIADIQGTVACPLGLDVPALLAARSTLGVMDRQRLPLDCKQLGSDGWLTEASDVLIPAAISDAVDEEKARLINSTILVEGANLPLNQAAERQLHERGIFIIPDFLANSAFAFIFGAILLGWVGPDKQAILDLIAQRLRSTTRQVLTGISQGVFPRDVVERIALENLERIQRDS